MSNKSEPVVDLFGRGLSARERRCYRRCAGAVVVNRAGLVFAGVRRDTPVGMRRPFLQMPQGGCEPDEKTEIAARRELLEETSITSIRLEKTHPHWLYYDVPAALGARLWQGQYQGQRQRWYCYRFTGRDTEINLDTGQPEFSHWQWLPAEQIYRRAIPFKQAIYRDVFMQFRSILNPEA